jgi:hypothetical protein
MFTFAAFSTWPALGNGISFVRLFVLVGLVAGQEVVVAVAVMIVGVEREREKPLG